MRDQACSCLHDILQTFQATPLLDPASNKITHLLNKYPPQRIQTDTYQDSAFVVRQRQKSVYTLDVVAVTLPLMSTEDRNAVLLYYKTLFHLQECYVTFRIIDGLHRLCLNPSLDVPHDLLLDLICSICDSVSQHKTTYITETISVLLRIGVARVYSLNRQSCEIKLPIVFDALKGIHLFLPLTLLLTNFGCIKYNYEYIRYAFL